MKLLFLFVVLIVTGNGYSTELLKGVSLYPMGFVRHFIVKPKANDGNLDYIAGSKSSKKDGWTFENGAGTFIDTYHQRSYMIFSNISHDNYKYGIYTPMLNVHCAYKGYSYSKDDRKIQCYPSFKLRIGRDKGFFTNIMPVPKVGSLTNGLVTIEIGYKF